MLPMTPIKPVPRTRGVRYIDVRLAIPDDDGLYPTTGKVVGYLRSSLNSVSDIPESSALPPSTYTFVPLLPNDEGPSNANILSPPVSPYDYRKAITSPALTATTVDSSESSLSVILDSRNASPALSCIVTPLSTPPIQENKICPPVSLSASVVVPHQQGRHTPSASPRQSPDPTKKSPFTRDDAGRLSRIKTE